jgi:hypothetical protein
MIGGDLCQGLGVGEDAGLELYTESIRFVARRFYGWEVVATCDRKCCGSVFPMMNPVIFLICSS